MTKAPARSFEVRHVQLARAAFAAIAAVMVTFSPDHSAVIGLSIFSGFALATGLVLVAAGWFVYTIDTRWPSVGLGTLSIIAGMAAGIAQLRNDTMFFVIVIIWALLTGLVETVTGARALRAARGLAKTDPARTESRDGLTVGILTLVLGLGLLFVPRRTRCGTRSKSGRDVHAHRNHHRRRHLRRYAAIVAVYLAIAGLSPRKAAPSFRRPEIRLRHPRSATDERGTA